MELSRRALGGDKENPIARVRAQLAADGIHVTDLTDTNPTRHGLLDEAVLDAVARATPLAHRYDPSPRGPARAREALAAHFGGHPDEYWLTASTSEAYSYLLTVLVNPGDAVAVPAPGYPLLEPLAQLAQAKLQRYPWHYVHPYGWMCDTAALAVAEGGPTVRALVAVNPGNPTGAYVDAHVRAALVETCLRGGTALIADEVFYPFSMGSVSPPPRLAGEQTVVTCALDGLSKLLCAPQLKLGWIRLTGPTAEVGELARALDHVSDTFLSVSGAVAGALPDLLTLSATAVPLTRERLSANLAAARAVFADGGFRVRATSGGWMVLVDVPRFLPDDELAVTLLQRAHLAVHPGWFYDMTNSGTLALSLLPHPMEFRSYCERLKAAVNALA